MLNLVGRWKKLSPAFGPFKNREVGLSIDQGESCYNTKNYTTERARKLA